MAKTKTKNNLGIHTSTSMEWQYLYDGNHWIDEDDERSASFKARDNSGHIRSRVITDTENRDTGESTTHRTAWVVKEQTLVPKLTA